MVQAFLYEELTSYLVTRNTSERRYFLRPSQELCEAILYCIADAQAQHPVAIHAFCAMSNHLHIVFTDLDGTAPLFVQAMNQNIARYVNCTLHRYGAMWEGGARPNYCVLPQGGDVMDKVVYTITNPVKAGLVDRHQHWPGALSTSSQISKGRILTKRPKKFFAKTTAPELLTRELILSPVPGEGVLSQEDYGKVVSERVAAEEMRIGKEREANGLRWFGRKNCLSLDPYDAPVKPWKPYSLRPTVSSKNDEAKRYRIQRQKRFGDLYKTAKKEFREGKREVAFPEGTFFMRVYWAVAVEPFL
ncbi:MAG: hypothetical protein C0393_09015 [Anaerolinea sp.]|nr:hypothetical protein [Anaerolinea sp.]